MGDQFNVNLSNYNLHTHANGINNIFSNNTVHKAVNWDNNSLMLRLTGTAYAI